MRRKLLIAATFILWSALLSLFVEFYTEARRVKTAEQVIIDQFAETYCNLRPAQSKSELEYQTGISALLSRMSIEAGVGAVARARYLECSIWGVR